MMRQTQPVGLLEDIQPDDEILFNDRRVPCTVEAAGAMEEYDGSIYVEYHIILEGPQGAEIWLQRTGTGRRRVKQSCPWGAYANVHSVDKVVECA